ncbi:solute carrier family 25 member 35 isoform X2 [Papio anubis]|uniref:solute carrier family 25 member 35 isoform X2 n=1 Tax=Papio anubis TaxID=9555 RepID=UPI0004F1FC65|nr:solute carrier family 25 member 35 isoform X2 [Papio anubis]
MDFLMSGLAACGACVFTNPLEVVKTRMQLQGELQAPGTYQRHYRNVFHAFITIGRVDGLAALQKGLAPALLYQFLMNGIRLGTYGLAEAGGYLHTAEGTHSPARSAAAGAMAGIMGAYLGSPIYMVKTHLQAQAASEIAVGHQYKHQGMFQALTEIGQKHGLVGLWRGALGGLPRVIVGSSTQLCTFSSTKDLLSQWEIFPPESWKLALVAAMVSGIAVVLAMAPFDVACTRLYNQPTDAQGKVVHDELMREPVLSGFLRGSREPTDLRCTTQQSRGRELYPQSCEQRKQRTAKEAKTAASRKSRHTASRK